MRVMHVFKGYYPTEIGGIVEFIRQLSTATKKLDVENFIFAMTPFRNTPEIEIIDGIKVYWCPISFTIASTPFSLKALLRFRKIAHSADIVHYHYPYPFADILHSLLPSDKKTLVTYHSDIIKQKFLLKVYTLLRSWFLNDTGAIVATSPNYLKTSRILQKYKHKVSVIPIGLSKELCSLPSEERMAFWTEKFGPRFFLFIGAMRYYKGLNILIQSAKLNDYPIVIAGGGTQEKKYRTLAKSLGAENVHFLSTVSEEDKGALLKLCYGVILPSHLRSEALGISLIEGIMYSKPIISCEIGTGTTYVNLNGETGFVIPPNDPEALNVAMKNLWDNEEKALEMGRRGFDRYQKIFTDKDMADSYHRLYSNLFN